jgi:O-antigen/teichoic acid export membrane protein
MKKQKIRSFLVGILLVGTLATPAFAAVDPPELPQEAASTQEVSSTQGVIVLSDQFVTYFRTYNGVKQYRIWNITQGIWVTDWTNVA